MKQAGEGFLFRLCYELILFPGIDLPVHLSIQKLFN
ncbi:hypothetical protein SAMN05444394_1960 [Algoriphagus halophilus]|uniref:Uncharacterized protein n=1 Tax=Algoriphagus halophilus TaxID=226505 RepID=A0A1N6EC14_9BACT|nr:hypothetical protein SAMN05444394_1960 [Algoriphagus halophilus]